jgi:putative DNA primase/helicase
MGKKADAWDVWSKQGPEAIKDMIEAAFLVEGDETERREAFDSFDSTPGRHILKTHCTETAKGEDYNLDSADDDIQKLRSALAAISKDAETDKQRHTAETIIGWGLNHQDSGIEPHIGAALSKEWDELSGGNSFETFTKSDPYYKHTQPVTTASIFDLAIKNGWKFLGGGGPPEPLPGELLPVAEFDYNLLPESLMPFVQDICERIQCPPDFVAVGIMTSLAAVIGRKIAIRPQGKTDWTVTPNLWALVVGRPGVLKSPALEAALSPLNRLVAQATKDHELVEKDFKLQQMVATMSAEAVKKAAAKTLTKDPKADITAMLEGCLEEIPAPELKRYKTNDSTPASLGELLRRNQNGLLVYRDEMVSLLKGLDREDQAEGRGFYLTGWNGDSPYTFDRIGRGLNLHIEAVCISLLGGTQPGRLAEYISQAVKGGASDDGLIQRFGLMVWPDTGGAWQDVDRWPDNKAKNQAYEVFDYLDKLRPEIIGAQRDTDIDGNPEGQPYLRFDGPGLQLFLEWRTDLENRLRGGDLHPAMESHLAKYRKLIPALALILHLADGGNGPVSERAVLQALGWGDYLETHAQRAYGAVSHPEVATAKAIIKRIKKGDLQTGFSCRDVWRPGWSGLTDREQVTSALKLLIEYGWLWSERSPTKGRAATVYHVTEGWPT